MSNYWERRAAWDLYKNLDDAEATADLIAKVYRSASMNLTYAAKDIFEKYMTKHKLSETEARRLLDTLQDNTSLDELLQTLKNKDYSEKTKQELVQELEAPAYRARLERLQDVMQQVDKLMENVYHQEQQFDTSFLRDLGEKAYYQSIYNVQKRTGLGFSFSHISQKQVDQVLRMNWSGKHYSKRIWKNTENLAQTLKEEMLVSLLTGRTDRETAQIIENKFGAGAIQARRLVRTESCFVAGELTARAYEECGVEKYRYLATLDLRTSEICRSLDGKVFTLSERLVGKNHPPMHPWCRSTTISIIDEETLARMKKRAYKELMAEAKNTLASDGLPQELAEVLDYSDADTCKKSMEKVKEVFQRAVETAVEEKLKGGKPPKKAPGGDAQKALEEQVYNIMMGNN